MLDGSVDEQDLFPEREEFCIEGGWPASMPSQTALQAESCAMVPDRGRFVAVRAAARVDVAEARGLREQLERGTEELEQLRRVMQHECALLLLSVEMSRENRAVHFDLAQSEIDEAERAFFPGVEQNQCSDVQELLEQQLRQFELGPRRGLGCRGCDHFGRRGAVCGCLCDCLRRCWCC